VTPLRLEYGRLVLPILHASMTSRALLPKMGSFRKSSCSGNDDGGPTISIRLRSANDVSLAFLQLSLSQPEARATAVFVDEIDAGRFKCPPNNLKSRTAGLSVTTF
jgi:hypothetical protein